MVGFPMPPPFLAGRAAGAALVLIKKLRTGSFSTARRFANSIRYCAQGGSHWQAREGGRGEVPEGLGKQTAALHPPLMASASLSPPPPAASESRSLWAEGASEERSAEVVG